MEYIQPIMSSEWVSPYGELRRVVIRYIEVYGLSYAKTGTEVRRDVKQIIDGFIAKQASGI